MVPCHYTNNCSSPSLSWYQSHYYTMSSIPSSSSLTSITRIHSYSQFQYHSLSKCQTRQEKLPTVAFPVPSSSQTPWSRGPRRRNLSASGPVSSTEKNTQPTINPEYTRWIKLDQMLLCWFIFSLTEAVLTHVVASLYLVICGALWSECLRHPPELE